MFHCNVDLANVLCSQPFTYLKLLQTCELIFQDGGLNWFENLNKSPWKLSFSQRFLHLKFKFSKKATEIDKIFTVNLTLT